MTNPSTRSVSAKYGAPMGRRDNNYLEGKVTLSNVVIDSGGYDDGGAYWGLGPQLWTAWDEIGNETYFRAPSRASAMAYLAEMGIEAGAVTFEPQNWTLYWHVHECEACGDICTSPSDHEHSGTCDCGEYFEGDAILETETELMEFEG